MVKVGPWGGNDGTHLWQFQQLEGDWRLSHIKICSDSECVYSIQFTQSNVNTGETRLSKTYGGAGGTPDTVIFSKNNEQLIEIQGTFGPEYAGCVVITSLSFKTNVTKYRSYGPGGGTPFSLPVEEGKVAGFAGKYGDRLYNLGVILKES